MAGACWLLFAVNLLVSSCWTACQVQCARPRPSVALRTNLSHRQGGGQLQYLQESYVEAKLDLGAPEDCLLVGRGSDGSSS